jgi:hypothetical protein
LIIVALAEKSDEVIGLPSMDSVAINTPANRRLNRTDLGKRFPFGFHFAGADFGKH